MPVPHPETLEPGVMYLVEFTVGLLRDNRPVSIHGVFVKTSVKCGCLLLHFRVRGSNSNMLLDLKSVTTIVKGG